MGIPWPSNGRSPGRPARAGRPGTEPMHTGLWKMGAGLAAAPVLGPRGARTRGRCPGITGLSALCQTWAPPASRLGPHLLPDLGPTCFFTRAGPPAILFLQKKYRLTGIAGASLHPRVAREMKEIRTN